MGHPLIKAKNTTEFPTRERCFITELLNDERAPCLSLARCRVGPGVTTELHSLTVDEWYIVKAGVGLMRVGDEEFAVGAGDTVAISANVAQCISNTGSGDLIFECVCVPRFTPAAYRPLENP